MVGNSSAIVSTGIIVALHYHASSLSSSIVVTASATARDDHPRQRQRQRRRMKQRQPREQRRIVPESNSNATTTTTSRKLANCGTAGWHPEKLSGENDGCSNDDHFPREWVTASFSTQFFHGTAEECCDAVFEPFGLPCKIYECVGGAAAGGGGDAAEVPATTPTSSSLSSSSSSGCAWHADLKTQDGCTNDDNYPQEWTSIKRGTRSHMFHATHEACCSITFPNHDAASSASSCAKYDRGCEVVVRLDGTVDGVPPPTPKVVTKVVTKAVTPKVDCVIPGWHPDMGGANDGCSNDDKFPQKWLTTGDSRYSLFLPSFQKCCDAWFKNTICKRYDQDSSSCRVDPSLLRSSDVECDGPLWYPDAIRRRGCTNAPPAGNVGTLISFDSARACCDKFHDADGRCAAWDGCTGEATYFVVTRNPTGRPTNPPTKRPTQIPTKRPTPLPSTSPTVAPPKFFIVHGEGYCANAKFTAMPYYIEETYDDIITCCNSSWAKDKCIAYMQAQILLESGGALPRFPTFYVVHGVGTCADADITPMPHYTRESYRDMKTCCNSSWAKEKCIADMKANLLGGGGDLSGTPTLLPTTLFVPDTVVEIHLWGSMQVQHVAIPGMNAPEEWYALEDLFAKSMHSVMMGCPISHPGLSVTVNTFGGLAFPSSRNRQLSSSKGNDADNEEDEEATSFPLPKKQKKRRATTASELKFEMTIPAKCDDSCQNEMGHPGRGAFDEIESHFKQYIEVGMLDSTLAVFGVALGLYEEGDESSQEAPHVSSGTLTYRSGTPSTITWVPTFMPTVEMPTVSPTLDPTGNPTKEPTPPPTPNSDEPTTSPTTACSALRWHYENHGECSNDPDYPRLWDIRLDIGAHFLHDSVESCCVKNSHSEWCIVTDVCDATIGSVSMLDCNTRDMKYHPTTPGERTCTNSEEYPAAWRGNDRFLFESAQDCCAAYYSDELCFVKNVCY